MSYATILLRVFDSHSCIDRGRVVSGVLTIKRLMLNCKTLSIRF